MFTALDFWVTTFWLFLGFFFFLSFLLHTSVSGGSELTVKVPDSITEWKASAFCLSGATGLGLSPTISLTVFQPFFLELTLPYSVVRGEAFTLKATVFNYMSHCIRVRVLLLWKPVRTPSTPSLPRAPQTPPRAGWCALISEGSKHSEKSFLTTSCFHSGLCVNVLKFKYGFHMITLSFWDFFFLRQIVSLRTQLRLT